MTTHDMYANAAQNAFTENVSNLNDDTNTIIKVALLDSAHSPDLSGAGHDSWGDVSADEVTGTNYDAGGKEIQNMTLTVSGRTVTFDGDNVVWQNSTITAGYAVVYDATPTDDLDKKLLTLIDFGGEESSSDGDFSIEWDSAGVFQVDTNPA